MNEAPPAGPGTPSSLVESWRRQPWPMRILRAFLGGTFVYAGIQKLGDPNFLHSGTPDYIGTQLQNFLRGSPIRPLLAVAAHAPVLTGVIVALVEMAVGLATLLEVAPKTTAATGLGINAALFLSATWHVSPYFLGSDSIYAVAWAAYLTGLVEAERRRASARRTHGTRRQRFGPDDSELSRRQFLRGGLVGCAALFIGAVAFGTEGKESAAADPPAAGAALSPSPSLGRHRSSPHAPTGTPIAQLDRLPVGGSATFQDPASGPAILLRLGEDRVAAFSRVCTHAGCLVNYDQGAGLLVCPCHGAEFDPARKAQPVAGPAPTALPQIHVVIDQSSGTVFAQD